MAEDQKTQDTKTQETQEKKTRRPAAQPIIDDQAYQAARESWEPLRKRFGLIFGRIGVGQDYCEFKSPDDTLHITVHTKRGREILEGADTHGITTPQAPFKGKEAA